MLWNKVLPLAAGGLTWWQKNEEKMQQKNGSLYKDIYDIIIWLLIKVEQDEVYDKIKRVSTFFLNLTLKKFFKKAADNLI